MNPVRMLGIGSPFGDDQAGWLVINQLQQHQSMMKLTADSLHLACCDRPGLGLLDLMQGVDTVILIDAVKTGSPIGTLHELHDQAIEQMYPVLSTHAIGIGYALQLGRALNSLPNHIILYGIEISEVQLDEAISTPVKKAIAQLVAILLSIAIPLQ